MDLFLCVVMSHGARTGRTGRADIRPPLANSVYTRLNALYFTATNADIVHGELPNAYQDRQVLTRCGQRGRTQAPRIEPSPIPPAAALRVPLVLSCPFPVYQTRRPSHASRTPLSSLCHVSFHILSRSAAPSRVPQTQGAHLSRPPPEACTASLTTDKTR